MSIQFHARRDLDRDMPDPFEGCFITDGRLVSKSRIVAQARVIISIASSSPNHLDATSSSAMHSNAAPTTSANPVSCSFRTPSTVVSPFAVPTLFFCRGRSSDVTRISKEKKEARENVDPAASSESGPSDSGKEEP